MIYQVIDQVIDQVMERRVVIYLIADGRRGIEALTARRLRGAYIH